MPRVALTATNAVGPITSPATSLLVYNTATAGTAPNNVVPGYYYWNGTAWILLTTTPSSGPAWSTTGNAGTTAGTNFIGTTDATDFVVKTNNTEKARVSSTGSFGIGSSAFNATNSERLLVDAGTSSYNVISGKGNINSFLQLNIKNINAGTGASSDVVATNDYGTDANGLDFIDMGVNSSANTSTGVLGGANTAYLYSTGNDLAIGNATSGKNLFFFTGGTGANERMRIDGNGNVGIGTTAPTQKLDVNGSINAASSIYLDGANSNTGTKTPGVIFGGSSSGEGISSKRTSGTDQYGLDFYTASSLRMSVTQTGNVGIGTNVPASTLDVQGTVNLGVGGTPFNNIMRGTFTITNSTVISNGDKQTSTVTINGVTTGANVILNPQAALPGAIGIASVRVSAANTIVIAFINTSTTALAVGTVTFTYTIIQ